MRKFGILLIMFLAVVSQTRAEDHLHALIAKGGPSYFVSTQLGGVGGGPSSSSWRIGPTFALGLQFPRSEELSLVLMFQHSWHSFAPAERTTVEGSPQARVTEVTFSAKYGRDLYFLGGLGYSSQHRDDANFVTYLGNTGTASGGDQTMFLLLIGMGGRFRISSNLAAIVEGTCRFRTYSSLALETGIAWEW